MINETFMSIQGEGRRAGVPSYFVRFAGCNLRCKWCDTKYAWKKNPRGVTLEEVMNGIRDEKPPNVVITGGEPLLFSRDVALITQMNSYSFEIETNGTIMPSPTLIFRNARQNFFFNVSPKLISSGEPDTKRLNFDALNVFNQMGADFKFVISDSEDFIEMQSIISEVGISNDRVFLMPNVTNKHKYVQAYQDIINLCVENRYQVSQRLHILFWGRKRGV